MKKIIFLILALMISMQGIAFSQYVGSATIRAPAVVLGLNTGVLSTITLNVTNGNGIVKINGPTYVGNSTLDSAITAVNYAGIYLNKNSSKYDFTYTILNASNNVSGPSAGAALTLLAISALSGKPLKTGFTITGTISSNGQIGEIGGAYDKAGAAKADGMNYILVPGVSQNSQEDMLYTLTQSKYDIPLVQVYNISQAVGYAIYGNSIYGKNSIYNPFVNYKINSISDSNLTCANCNIGAFINLTNYTFTITSKEIKILNNTNGFGGISNQLLRVLNQSEGLANKGYYYAAADMAFIDYLDAYYFNQNNVTIGSGLATINSINASCSNLLPPNINKQNYEYVIGGELRQAWANYTLNEATSSYNAVAVDTDGVLSEISLAGEANAWCSASSYMYNISSANQSEYVFLNSIKTIALNRINSASNDTGMYQATALQAYKQGNYPLAIIDADYAIAFANGSGGSLTTGEKINQSISIASNSTFGIWASEFAKESTFYAQEARISNNQSNKSYYALEAYSTALLAQKMNTDFNLIYKNMVPGTQTQAQQVQMVSNSIYNEQAIAILTSIRKIIIFAVGILLLILITAILILIAVMCRKGSNASKQRKTKK